MIQTYEKFVIEMSIFRTIHVVKINYTVTMKYESFVIFATLYSANEMVCPLFTAETDSDRLKRDDVYLYLM